MQKESEVEYTSIRVSVRTRDRFISHGRYDQSADDILNQILDVYEKVKRK